jgi:predicted nucleic acid-binding protein
VRRYWDSDCFLGWLQEEDDKVPLCRPVIREAEAGKLTLVTSALTLAEVLMLRHGTPIPKEAAETVERFFEHEWIEVSEVDRFIAEQARRLVWDHGIRPKDAIHVATALDADVVQLDTFDTELMKKSEAVGNPPLKIGRPNLPPTLFDDAEPAIPPQGNGPSGDAERA